MSYALYLLNVYTCLYTRSAVTPPPIHQPTHISTQLVSDSVAMLLRKQTNTLSRDTTMWRLAKDIDPMRDAKLVHGTPIVPGLTKVAAQSGYVQLTLSIKSLQQTAVYDHKGKVKKDWDDPPVEKEDFWVFEHPLGPQWEARWRLAGMVNPYQEVDVSRGAVDPAVFSPQRGSK